MQLQLSNHCDMLHCSPRVSLSSLGKKKKGTKKKTRTKITNATLVQKEQIPPEGCYSLASCSSPSWAPSSLASFSSLLRLFFLCLWRRWLSPSSLSCCLLWWGGKGRGKSCQSLHQHCSAAEQTRAHRLHSTDTDRGLWSRRNISIRKAEGTTVPGKGFLVSLGRSDTACSWTEGRECKVLGVAAFHHMLHQHTMQAGSALDRLLSVSFLGSVYLFI